MSARAWLSLSITAALWGASYMFIKVALDGGLSEGFIICARTLLGAAVLLPLAIRAGVDAGHRPVRPDHLRREPRALGAGRDPRRDRAVVHRADRRQGRPRRARP